MAFIYDTPAIEKFARKAAALGEEENAKAKAQTTALMAGRGGGGAAAKEESAKQLGGGSGGSSGGSQSASGGSMGGSSAGGASGGSGGSSGGSQSASGGSMGGSSAGGKSGSSTGSKADSNLESNQIPNQHPAELPEHVRERLDEIAKSMSTKGASRDAIDSEIKRMADAYRNVMSHTSESLRGNHPAGVMPKPSGATPESQAAAVRDLGGHTPNYSPPKQSAASEHTSAAQPAATKAPAQSALERER